MAVDTELEEIQDASAAPDEGNQSEGDDQSTDGDQDAQSDAGEPSDGSGSRAMAKGSIRLPGVRVTFSENAAIIPDNLSWDGWKKSFNGAADINDMSKWWRGDLLIFAMDGERYGQRYSQFLDGENIGSFKNLISICRKFAPDQRNAALTFTHHVAAAPLMPDHAEVADEILNKAAAENWAVADVRAAVREYLEGPQEGDDEPAAPRTRQATPMSEPVGVQPMLLENIESGAEYYECPNAACEPYGFLEPVLHCIDCSAHYSPDAESCPHCPPMEEIVPADQSSAASDATEAPTAISGTVITPDDQDVADEDDEPTQTSLSRVLTLVPHLVNMDPAITASDLARVGGINMTRAVALHEWLGKVVAALPNQSSGKPLMPAPKPTGGKRRGRPSKRQAAAETDTTED